jgi:hypothetical protein
MSTEYLSVPGKKQKEIIKSKEYLTPKNFFIFNPPKIAIKRNGITENNLPPN